MQAFSQATLRHLMDHGMDSVFYIPVGPGIQDVVNIVEGYNKYTVRDVVSAISDYTANGFYDTYDMHNLRDSSMFLLKSIDESLMRLIEPFVTKDSTGPEVWMRLDW